MAELIPYSRNNELTFDKYLITQIATVTSISKGIQYAAEGIKTEIKQGIASLSANFNYAMEMLSSRLEEQNKVQIKMLSKLDEIHDTLKRPRITEAREWYERGIEDLKRGFYEKALNKFFKAEEIDDSNYLIYYQIGRLYLYGVNEDENVINIPKALKYYNLAARYAKSEIEYNHNIDELCAECYFHASIACYLLANEYYKNKKIQESIDYYHKAFDLVQKAIQINQYFNEAKYHCAKYLSLIEEKQKAIKYIKEIINSDFNYLIKITLDGDFEILSKEINSIMRVKIKELIKELEDFISYYVYENKEEKKIEIQFKDLINESTNLLNKDIIINPKLLQNLFSKKTDLLNYINSGKEINGFVINISADSNWLICYFPKEVCTKIIDICSLDTIKIFEKYSKYTTAKSLLKESKYLINYYSNLLRVFGKYLFSKNMKYIAILHQYKGFWDTYIVEVFDCNNFNLKYTDSDKNIDKRIIDVIFNDKDELIIATEEHHKRFFKLINIESNSEIKKMKFPKIIGKYVCPSEYKMYANANFLGFWKVDNQIDICDFNNIPIFKSIKLDGLDLLTDYYRISPNKKYIVARVLMSGNKECLKIWSLENTKVIGEIIYSTRVKKAKILFNRCDFSIDGKYISIINSNKDEVNDEVDIYTLPELNKTKLSFNNTCSCVCFSPICNYLAIALTNNKIELWDIENNKKVKNYITNFKIFLLIFSPDGKYLIGIGESRSIIWNILQINKKRSKL